MKIAVLNIYSGLVNRGAETVSDALATEWTNLGHEICVIAGGETPGRKYQQETVSEINVLETESNLSYWEKVLRFLGTLSTYEKVLVKFTVESLKLIDEFKPDVVFAMNGSRQVEVLAKSDFAKKTIALVHGQAERKWWKLGGQENLRIIRQEIAGFVLVNSGMKEWALRHASNTKIEAIPNGVDLSFFKPEEKLRKSNQILCVAGLQKYKQVELLIKAVKKIQNVQLLIVGKGSEKPNLENLVDDLKMTTRVKFLEVNHARMPELYNRAKVFSLPSMSIEAFGVSYLEAMACGLPVVAPEDDARKYIVGNAGILVDVNNIEKYSEALKIALDKDWEKLPRKQAEKFGWGEIAKKYLEMFKKI